MRTIGVVSVGRSDYSYYRPILRRIQADPDLRLCLIVSGMHLSPEFGLTVKEIKADGFEIAECVEMLVDSDTPSGIAKSIGLGIIGFIGIQVFVNLFSMARLMPLTGVPLPLISYGGSSLVVNLLALGIILNMSRQMVVGKKFKG